MVTKRPLFGGLQKGIKRVLRLIGHNSLDEHIIKHDKISLIDMNADENADIKYPV